MKLFYFLLVASLLPYIAHADIAVVGPDGESELLYRLSDQIIAKTCPKYHVVEDASAASRRQCAGDVSISHVEFFRTYLQKRIIRENDGAPFTPEMLTALRYSPRSGEEISQLTVELKKIDDFISKYGSENADLYRKKEIERLLADDRNYRILKPTALKLVDDVISEILENSGQSHFSVLTFSKNKSEMSYKILKGLQTPLRRIEDPKSPQSNCGEKGTLSERLQDCSVRFGLLRDSQIVTKSRDYVVYRASKSGEFVGVTLSRHHEGEAFSICDKALPGLFYESGSTWHIASSAEYENVGILNSDDRDLAFGYTDLFWVLDRKERHAYLDPETLRTTRKPIRRGWGWPGTSICIKSH